MPYRKVWEEPELFLSRRGVRVYHTYVNDSVDDGIDPYWYTLELPVDEVGDQGVEVFDVRSLTPWIMVRREMVGATAVEMAKATLIEAIDTGEVSAELDAVG